MVCNLVVSHHAGRKGALVHVRSKWVVDARQTDDHLLHLFHSVLSLMWIEGEALKERVSTALLFGVGFSVLAANGTTKSFRLNAF